MTHAKQAGAVVPNPRLPRTMGILNIVFGSLLILAGLGKVVSTLYMPAVSAMMRAQQAKMEADALAKEQEDVADLLAGLAEREKAATTPAQKEEIEAERAAIRSRPKPFVPNMTAGTEVAQDPAFVRFNWGEILTGLALNAPMLASGIALLRLREWGRRLALWVAGLKLVRLLVLTIASLIVVAPLMTRMMGQEFEKVGTQMQQAGRGAGPVQAQQLKQMRFFTGIAMTASYVGFYALGAIYPAVVLRVLTRPGVRAACNDAKPGPDPLS
jgi:hypothetical protein